MRIDSYRTLEILKLQGKSDSMDKNIYRQTHTQNAPTNAHIQTRTKKHTICTAREQVKK